MGASGKKTIVRSYVTCAVCNMFMELGGLFTDVFQRQGYRKCSIFASFITERQISVMFLPCVKSEGNLSAVFLTSTKKILNSETREKSTNPNVKINIISYFH